MAALALCEASAMTGDPWLSRPMRRALAYTVNAQNLASGGWRYKPNERGDTSQLGWQLMALKSAQMAGLSVSTPVMEGANKWLKSCAKGQGGTFSYEPPGGATPAGLEEVIASDSPWGALSFLVSEDTVLEGRTPLQTLRDGGIDIIRRMLAQRETDVYG